MSVERVNWCQSINNRECILNKHKSFHSSCILFNVLKRSKSINFKRQQSLRSEDLFSEIQNYAATFFKLSLTSRRSAEKLHKIKFVKGERKVLFGFKISFTLFHALRTHKQSSEKEDRKALLMLKWSHEP